MALATSGALTLDQIHVEAGGTTGTACSLNDSDIRGLTAASGRTINSTLGTNIDFADFYGASSVSSILSWTGSLNVAKTAVTQLTGYDYKGNPIYSTVGVRYVMTLNNWNSLSNNSGTNSVANYLHTGSASATSPGSTNFMGALHANATYDLVTFTWNHFSYTSGVVSRSAIINFYKLNSGSSAHYPVWDVNAAAPTGWSNFKLEFTHGGTTYTWNYSRSSDFAAYNEAQYGGTSGYGIYYISALSSSADSNFAPTLNVGANLTISGATIEIT